MCGIVGFITTETKIGEQDRSKFLRQALIIDTLRGDDSTGAYAVGHEPIYDDGTAYWFKQLGDGHSFVNTKEYWEQFYDVAAYRCVVGHNRAATMGGIDTDAAHPFQEGPITLVHNGTLTSTHVLPSPMSSLDGVTVDSHAIAHNLARHDVSDVVENLYGAFALVWHDARDNSMNVIRNTKRPLHFALGSNGKTLYFMSEGEMLTMLDRRLRLGLRDIYYPEDGVHLKWTPDCELAKPEVTELDLYEDKWPRVYNQNYSGYGVMGYDDDDDEYPFSGYNNPKPNALPESNQVFLGGRRQDIPMRLQEQMLALDVVVEDRLRFTPEQSFDNGQKDTRYTVVGKLEGARKGVLYGVQEATTKRANSDWTVRCLGVKIDKNGQTWYICKLMSTFVNPAQLTSSIISRYTNTTRGGALANIDMVPDADGVMVTASEFYRQTSDGCVMCRKQISIQDAHDLVWTSHGAICPTCDDRLYGSEEVH